MSFAKKLFTSKASAEARQHREMQKRAAEKERQIEEYYAKEFNYAPLAKSTSPPSVAKANLTPLSATTSASSSSSSSSSTPQSKSTYVPHGPNPLKHCNRDKLVVGKKIKYNMMPSTGHCL